MFVSRLFTTLVSAIFVGLFAIYGCSDGGTDPSATVATPAVVTPTTSTLTLAITDAASSQALSVQALDEDDSGRSITAASDSEVSSGEADSDRSIAAISDYTVTCKDGSGVKYSGTIDASGNATVSGIPTTEKVVCYILDSSGAPVTQFFQGDTSVIGGKVDAVGISSDTSATVSFNSNSKGASMTCSNCASATSASSDIDLTGTYGMSCQGVYNSATDQLDSTQTCPADFSTGSVYLHRVQYTNSSGGTVDAYGAWPSLAAYTSCGSTEGLDNLPTGATLLTSGQSNPFSWSGGFTTFTSSSTTTNISGFISSAATSTLATSNGKQSYAAYTPLSCGIGFMANANTCESSYYWQQLDSIGRSGAACLPRFTFTWGSSGVSAITSKASNGGTTSPSARFDFMNVQWYGSEMRMSSQNAEVFPAWDTTNNTSVDCRFKEEMLISFATPGATPATGAVVPTKFVTNTDVASISGRAADTTVCESQFGSFDGAVSNGSYMMINMTKQ